MVMTKETKTKQNKNRIDNEFGQKKSSSPKTKTSIYLSK